MDIHDILRRLQISELNSMQKDAVESILNTEQDVMILSLTGTGKTLAYLLPISQMLDATCENVQTVVVVPGRELALQSADVFRSMGSGLRCATCYGGRPAMDEHRVLNQVRPHVIFGTPGRLVDHLNKGNFNAEHVKMLILDEFDKCMQMGFMAEMTELVGLLPNVKRRILLSATKPETLEFVNPKRLHTIDFLPEDRNIPSELFHYKIQSPEKDKLVTLHSFLNSVGNESTIVFLNHRDAVERTESYLREHGFVTSLYHGGLDQQAREIALYKFACGAANILVCTDLASRGLDIPDVNNIVHYHLPETKDAYIHRVGRTSRWDKSGRTFFLLGPSETVPDYVDAEIQNYSIPFEPQEQSLSQQKQSFRPQKAILYIGKGKKDKLSKGDIVGFLCKKGGLNASEIGRIDVKDRYTYAAIDSQKLNSVLRNVQGEKIKGIKTIVETIK